MKIVLGFASALLVVGCGGGGGGDSGSTGSTEKPADVIDSLIQSSNGGSRYVSLYATDGAQQSSSSNGCSYNSFPSRSILEGEVSKQGGTVLTSTPDEWCGTVGNESICVKRIGGGIVVDSHDAQGSEITLNLPNLVPEHVTVVDFSATNTGLNALASVMASTKDASIPSDVKCDVGVPPNFSSNVINGQWNGYKMDYSPAAKRGSTANATISCVDQSCNISGITISPIILSEFRSGTWRTASGARQLAGASLTADQKLLSAFLCNSPLDESKTFENCSFFTFKR